MKFLMFMFLAALVLPAQAKELNGVTMPDEINLEGQKLILNGIGLREKKKLGMWWKVYVGGLYLKTKSSDETAIIADPSPKQLVMEYVRSVDKKTLADGWADAFKRACIKSCADMGESVRKFEDLVTAVNKKTRVSLTFYKDKVKVSSTVEGDAGGTIEGADFRSNLLNVFIGKKAPPTPEFRKSILGLK